MKDLNKNGHPTKVTTKRDASTRLKYTNYKTLSQPFLFVCEVNHV
jgi:hypothetical protein